MVFSLYSSACVPLWLVMRGSLKTHDTLRQWDVGVDADLNLLRTLTITFSLSALSLH
ncbi:hypothetical protein Tco_0795986, partial [Tanacetum coccineum]